MEKEFNKIIEAIAKNKGLTKKTSERLIVDLVENPKKLQLFQQHLKEIQQSFGICPTCFYLTYLGKCEICSNPERDSQVITVVSSVLDALNIEKYNKYNGVYAILQREINLIKNLAPEQLQIEPLLKRLKPGMEVILALNTTFEGELTANYIAKKILIPDIKISRIAKGIPMGGMLDYMDETTLENALKNRKKMGGK